jgi:hypothetical protein
MITEACLDSGSVTSFEVQRWQPRPADFFWSIKVKQLATTFLQNRDPIPESQGDEFVKFMGG